MNMHLHTHLAETKDEEQFCLQRFGYVRAISPNS